MFIPLMSGDASKLVTLDFFSLCFSVFSNFPAMNMYYLGNRELKLKKESGSESPCVPEDDTATGFWAQGAQGPGC